jgi:hypothetical protein
LLQLVRRKSDQLSILQLPPPLAPIALPHTANIRALSNALVAVLSINVFVLSSLASFCLLLIFYPQ